VVTTGRFGFFGGAAAVEVSAPDFLCSTAAAVVDFLPTPPLSVAFGSSLPAVLSPPCSGDWDDSDEAGGEDESVSEGVESVGESFGESFGDDEESEDAESDEEEPVDPVSDGPAHATPGVVATATPTPKATAKPPTRPT